MRLFTAIDLSPEIRDRLEKVIATLRPLARVAWSKPENLHITTKFIGEWPEDRLPPLARALSGLAERAAISIRVHGLGFFPDKKPPRVFWAGVESSAQLAGLAEDVNEALATLGVEREIRPYSPHLTLARIKAPTGLERFHESAARLGQPEFGAFEADRFHLYLSKPGPAGSVYTKLSEFPFSTQ